MYFDKANNLLKRFTNAQNVEKILWRNWLYLNNNIT